MLRHWVKDGTPLSGEELLALMKVALECTMVGPIEPIGLMATEDEPRGDVVFTGIVAGVPTVRMVIAQDGLWMAGEDE